MAIHARVVAAQVNRSGGEHLALPCATPRAVASITEKTRGKTSVKTSVKAKTPTRILALLQAHPTLTLAEVAKEIGLTTRAVELAAAKLVKLGHLRYVGPQKGGHWEILPPPSTSV